MGNISATAATTWPLGDENVKELLPGGEGYNLSRYLWMGQKRKSWPGGGGLKLIEVFKTGRNRKDRSNRDLKNWYLIEKDV